MQWLNNKKNSALLWAVKKGSYTQVRNILWLGANPDAADETGTTALMHAAQRKRVAILGLLLGAGADTKAKGPQGNTALHLAAEVGYAEIGAAILKKSPESLEIKNVKGKTPLFRAVDGGHIPMVDTLIAKGADVNTRDNTQATPLIKAAETGYFQITSLLLKAGADVHAVDASKESAFLRTAENSYTNIIPMLLEAGADINSKDKNGDTMLHRAARRGRMKLMTALFDRGIDPAMINDKGETALHRAAENNHIQTALFLIDRGVLPEVPDKNGRTALYRAANAGLVDMTRALCERTNHDLFDIGIRQALEESRRKEQRELLDDGSVEFLSQSDIVWKKVSDTEIARIRRLPSMDQEQTDTFDFKAESCTSQIRYLSSNTASHFRQRFSEVADRELLAEAERQQAQIKADEALKKAPLLLPAAPSAK